MLKVALVLGSSATSVPIITRLSQAGFTVAVVGKNPRDPGCHLGDRHIQIDYADVNSVLDSARQLSVDVVVPGCNDVAYRSAALVASEFGLPGYDPPEMALDLHSKGGFRRRTKSFLSSPAHVHAVDLREGGNLVSLTPPLLYKPGSAHSGIGILKIESKQQLVVAIRNLGNVSNDAGAVFEDYVGEDLYSHSAFLQNGEIVADFFVDEMCLLNPFQVNWSFIPSTLPSNLREEARKQVRATAKGLDLVDGLLHSQFIVNSGKLYFLEVMRRCPGDFYGDMIRESSGFDYYDAYIRGFTGSNMRIVPVLGSSSILRHTISSSSPRIFRGVNLPRGAESYCFFPLALSGAGVEPAPSGKFGVALVGLSERISRNAVRQMAELDWAVT